MAKPAVCANPECPREIHDGWTYCRPCAVAHVNGEVPYIEACVGWVDPGWPSNILPNPTCDRCGYGKNVHPGRGIRRDLPILPAWSPVVEGT